MIDSWKNRTLWSAQLFWRSLVVALIFGAYGQKAEAQIGITATGQWDYSVSSFDITEAGLDFQGTYSSASDEVLVDVFQQGFIANFFNYNWQVDVRLVQNDWSNDLTLSARRTGNGDPFFFNGNITGGTAYLPLSTTNQNFFNGNRTRLDIPIQYQISGVSVLLPAKTYSATVIYTVTEL